MNELTLRKILKEVLDGFATKNDVREIVKSGLEGYANKDDLKNFATKEDLKNFATKDDLIAAKIEIQEMIDQAVADIVEIVDKSKADKKDFTQLETRVSGIEKTLNAT